MNWPFSTTKQHRKHRDKDVFTSTKLHVCNSLKYTVENSDEQVEIVTIKIKIKMNFIVPCVGNLAWVTSLYKDVHTLKKNNNNITTTMTTHNTENTQHQW